jgi:hypothetical protein
VDFQQNQDPLHTCLDLEHFPSQMLQKFKHSHSGEGLHAQLCLSEAQKLPITKYSHLVVSSCHCDRSLLASLMGLLEL